VLGTLLAHFSSSFFFFQGAPSTSSGWVRSTDDSEPPREVLPFSNSPIRYSSTSSGVPSRFLDIDPPTLLVQLPLASDAALQPHQLRLQLLVGAGQFLQIGLQPAHGGRQRVPGLDRGTHHLVGLAQRLGEFAVLLRQLAVVLIQLVGRAAQRLQVLPGLLSVLGGLC